MKAPAPAPADLQRWSEDVARDPASLSFMPLARAYRKQGRRDVALKLCLRGLEQHPTFVEAHALLAMLYFESGQHSKANDEWSMVLQLDPNNFEALRGMGFYHLEQGDDPGAMRSLQRAQALRPDDPTVQEALKIIQERNRTGSPSHGLDRDPWDDTPGSLPPSAPATFPLPPRTHSQPTLAPDGRPSSSNIPVRPVHLPPGARPTTPLRPVARPQSSSSDPRRLFDPLTNGGQILGVLLLDTQGLVLAGSLAGEPSSKSEELGAILGGTLEEIVRASDYLRLGNWRGILLESERALIQILRVREDTVVLVAARHETPAGWMARSAGHAAQLAKRFLEAYG